MLHRFWICRQRHGLVLESFFVCRAMTCSARVSDASLLFSWPQPLPCLLCSCGCLGWAPLGLPPALPRRQVASDIVLPDLRILIPVAGSASCSSARTPRSRRLFAVASLSVEQTLVAPCGVVVVLAVLLAMRLSFSSRVPGVRTSQAQGVDPYANDEASSLVSARHGAVRHEYALRLANDEPVDGCIRHGDAQSVVLRPLTRRTTHCDDRDGSLMTPMLCRVPMFTRVSGALLALTLRTPLALTVLALLIAVPFQALLR